MLQRVHKLFVSNAGVTATVVLSFLLHTLPAVAAEKEQGKPDLKRLMLMPGFAGAVVAVAGLHKSLEDILQNPMDDWRRQNAKAAISRMPDAVKGLAGEFFKGNLHNSDLPNILGIFGGYLDAGVADKLKRFATSKNPTPDMLPSLGKNFPSDVGGMTPATPGNTSRLFNNEQSTNVASTGESLNAGIPKNQIVQLNELSNNGKGVDIKARRIDSLDEQPAKPKSKDSLSQQLEDELNEVEKKVDSKRGTNSPNNRSRVDNAPSAAASVAKDYRTTVKPKYWRFHPVALMVQAALIHKAHAQGCPGGGCGGQGGGEGEEGGGGGAGEVLMAMAMILAGIAPMIIAAIQASSEEKQLAMNNANQQLALDKQLAAQDKARAMNREAQEEQMEALERQNDRQIAADEQKFQMTLAQNQQIAGIQKDQWQQEFDAKRAFEKTQLDSLKADADAQLASVQNLVNQKAAELDLVPNYNSVRNSADRLSVSRVFDNRTLAQSTNSTARTSVPGSTSTTSGGVTPRTNLPNGLAFMANKGEAGVAGRGIKPVSKAASNKLLASVGLEGEETEAEKLKKAKAKGKPKKKPVLLASLSDFRQTASVRGIANPATLSAINRAFAENTKLGGSSPENKIKIELKQEKQGNSSLTAFKARNDGFSNYLSTDRVRVVTEAGGEGDTSVHGGSGRGIRTRAVGGYNEPAPKEKAEFDPTSLLPAALPFGQAAIQ